MRISANALAVTSGLLWGGGVLCVGLIHLARPSYGEKFLDILRSVYPAFHGGENAQDVMVGTGYALIDGAVGGLIFASVYNLAAKKMS